MTTILGIKLPAETKITGRTSTIRTSFVKAIIPQKTFTDEEVTAWKEVLQIASTPVQCCYCGNQASELDHFNSVINDKEPTGFISDIYNLVPCCGKCNQSKGSSHWRTWITGKALLSPSRRGISDLPNRINILTNYEEWIKDKITQIRLEELKQNEAFIKYFKDCEDLLATFQIYQDKALPIKRMMNDIVLQMNKK